MLVPMTSVRIIGRRERLEEVLERLYELSLVELDDVGRDTRLELEPPPGAGDRAARREALRLLVAELDGLLELAGGDAAEAGETSSRAVDPGAVRAELDTIAPHVEELMGRIEGSLAEDIVLGRYVGLLHDLLAFVPELRVLDARFAALNLGTIVLVLSSDDGGIVDLLRQELRTLIGERFLLMSAPIESAVGCVCIYPLDAAEQVRELLGRQRVRQVPLPDPYRDLSLSAAVEAMQRRRGEIPGEVAAARSQLDEVLRPRVRRWRAAREALAARLAQIDAVRWAGATERAFVVSAWVPHPDLLRLERELQRLGSDVVLEELPERARDTAAPVLLQNARPARPFEFLVRFYDDPRARSLDPTGLLALFVPLMFGLMVGDVVYGALLLAAALLVRRRLGARSPVVRDGARVLAAGALWAVAFGVVFGEALGDLGERAFGMPAVWRHRDEADALAPLLLFALAIGAAHVVLGYLLALWQSWRDRSPQTALAPAGSLLVLCALFAVAAVAAGRIPTTALGPAAAAALAGLVIVSAPHGLIGLMLGPLELVGTIGNVLSYLRLAAVGFASVYLAVVANELAGVGPIWLGLTVAALLHALNLVLAGFTPAIQSLRLQYVEFFSKFFIGGGRPFRPFGTRDTSSAPAHIAPAGSGA